MIKLRKEFDKLERALIASREDMVLFIALSHLIYHCRKGTMKESDYNILKATLLEAMDDFGDEIKPRNVWIIANQFI